MKGLSLKGAVRLLTAPIGAVLIGLIWLYRMCISPFLAPTCRFQPTCSAYAIEAIRLHGPFKGTALAAARLARCHPVKALGGRDGYDPVPPRRENTPSAGS